MTHLSSLLAAASHAYDLDTLLAVYHLRALVALHFERPLKAIPELKCLMRVASDLGETGEKAHAYDLLG